MRHELLDRIDKTEHVESQVEHERQPGNARARDAENRHLARWDFDDHGEVQTEEAARGTE